MDEDDLILLSDSITTPLLSDLSEVHDKAATDEIVVDEEMAKSERQTPTVHMNTSSSCDDNSTATEPPQPPIALINYTSDSSLYNHYLKPHPVPIELEED